MVVPSILVTILTGKRLICTTGYYTYTLLEIFFWSLICAPRPQTTLNGMIQEPSPRKMVR